MPSRRAKKRKEAARSEPLVTTTVTAQPEAGAALGANWAALKADLDAQPAKKRRRRGGANGGGEGVGAGGAGTAEGAASGSRPDRLSSERGLTPVVALDCEMVGVGPEGKRSSLARVCLVNNAGHVLLDTFVAQKEAVTDYRTRFSGVRPGDLKGAPSLDSVAARVARLTEGRTLVGHSIHNDLKVLLLGHPARHLRDTARFPPLMRAAAPGRRPKPRALRVLAREELGLEIQGGEHSPVDDARAALYLYHRHRKEWERHAARGTLGALQAPRLLQGGGKAEGSRLTLAQLACHDDMADL